MSVITVLLLFHLLSISLEKSWTECLHVSLSSFNNQHQIFLFPLLHFLTLDGSFHHFRWIGRRLQDVKIHQWEERMLQRPVVSVVAAVNGRSFMQQLWFPTPDNDSESTVNTRMDSELRNLMWPLVSCTSSWLTRGVQMNPRASWECWQFMRQLKPVLNSFKQRLPDSKHTLSSLWRSFRELANRLVMPFVANV